jgi:hypothetical protein
MVTRIKKIDFFNYIDKYYRISIYYKLSIYYKTHIKIKNMKKSILINKKTITIGQIVKKYNNNIFWFIIILINYLLLHFLEEQVTKLKKSENNNLCLENLDCDKLFNTLDGKFCFSKKLILLNIILNLAHIIFGQYVLNMLSKYILVDILEFFSIWLFIMSSLFYKPLFFIIFSNKKPNDITTILEKNTFLLISLMAYYVIIELLAIVLIVLIIMFCVILLLDKAFQIIKNFYQKNLENITIEYIESKQIQEIDKIV